MRRETIHTITMPMCAPLRPGGVTRFGKRVYRVLDATRLSEEQFQIRIKELPWALQMQYRIRELWASLTRNPPQEGF